MQVFCEAKRSSGLMLYRVAGQWLWIDALDESSKQVIERLFAEWYLIPERPGAFAKSAPILQIRHHAIPRPIPPGSERFEVAGDGVCHTSGASIYIDIEGSRIAIGPAGIAHVEVWINGRPGLESLTRIVSYAVSSALRRGDAFELHCGAVVQPQTNKGALVIGPSGSGKSTITIQLASSGWNYLSDDVVMLRVPESSVEAWPMRRCFAITSETFATSVFLQSRESLNFEFSLAAGKQRFSPHGVFVSQFAESCVPQALFFSSVTGEEQSRISRLSSGDTFARLIRMSPWACYDRSSASHHLAALSHLVRQSTGYELFAGKDLLEPDRASTMLSKHLSN
jgi:hypothetical protein